MFNDVLWPQYGYTSKLILSVKLKHVLAAHREHLSTLCETLYNILNNFVTLLKQYVF